MNEDYDPYDIPDREEAQNPNTYAEFEKQQQKKTADGHRKYGRSGSGRL